jgi:hypothetical protein
MGDSFSGGKAIGPVQAGPWNWSLTSSSAEIKSGGAISPLPHTSLWYSVCLINDRGNFTPSSRHHPWPEIVLLHRSCGRSGCTKRRKTLQEKRRWRNRIQEVDVKQGDILKYMFCPHYSRHWNTALKKKVIKKQNSILYRSLQILLFWNFIFLHFLSFPRLLVRYGVSVLSAPF